MGRRATGTPANFRECTSADALFGRASMSTSGLRFRRSSGRSQSMGACRAATFPVRGNPRSPQRRWLQWTPNLKMATPVAVRRHIQERTWSVSLQASVVRRTDPCPLGCPSRMWGEMRDGRRDHAILILDGVRFGGPSLRVRLDSYHAYDLSHGARKGRIVTVQRIAWSVIAGEESAEETQRSGTEPERRSRILTTVAVEAQTQDAEKVSLKRRSVSSLL